MLGEARGKNRSLSPGPGVDDKKTETAGIQAEGLTKQEMDEWLGDDWPGIDGG